VDGAVWLPVNASISELIYTRPGGFRPDAALMIESGANHRTTAGERDGYE
jgi:hypothetical protein